MEIPPKDPAEQFKELNERVDRAIVDLAWHLHDLQTAITTMSERAAAIRLNLKLMATLRHGFVPNSPELSRTNDRNKEIPQLPGEGVGE